MGISVSQADSEQSLSNLNLEKVQECLRILSTNCLNLNVRELVYLRQCTDRLLANKIEQAKLYDEELKIIGMENS